MSEATALILALAWFWFACGFLVGASWALRRCTSDLVKLQRQARDIENALTIIQMKRYEGK